MTVNITETKSPTTQPEQSVDVVKQEIPVQQNIDNRQQEQTQTQTQPQESTEDPNWRAFREARKKDRAEREAAERRAAEKEAEAAALKAALEAAFQKSVTSPTQQMQYNSYEVEETEDQKIEKKVQEALEKREAEYRRQLEEQENREYPNRLRKTYVDFGNVVSQENLDYLDFHYPEISRPLQRLSDSYDKWSDIYLAIKRFVPNNTNVKKEAVKADQNHMKPRSISSQGLTQPQSVPSTHILSEEKKAANWARMQQHLKGIG